MATFQREMQGKSFPTGEGEISGSIWIEETHISFDDGWNVYPELRLTFCPFCGKRRIDK